MQCLVSFVLLVVMVALYTMSSLMHLFSNRYASLFLQLQLSALMISGWVFLIMRVHVLSLVMIDLTLLMQLSLTLTVLLWKFLCNLWPTGKCVSIKLRKLRSMCFLTFLLNGGLNQVMLRCLFVRGCCVSCGMYSSLWLKLLCPSAL